MAVSKFFRDCLAGCSGQEGFRDNKHIFFLVFLIPLKWISKFCLAHYVVVSQKRNKHLLKSTLFWISFLLRGSKSKKRHRHKIKSLWYVALLCVDVSLFEENYCTCTCMLAGQRHLCEGHKQLLSFAGEVPCLEQFWVAACFIVFFVFCQNRLVRRQV